MWLLLLLLLRLMLFRRLLLRCRPWRCGLCGHRWARHKGDIGLERNGQSLGAMGGLRHGRGAGGLGIVV